MQQFISPFHITVSFTYFAAWDSIFINNLNFFKFFLTFGKRQLIFALSKWPENSCSPLPWKIRGADPRRNAYGSKSILDYKSWGFRHPPVHYWTGAARVTGVPWSLAELLVSDPKHSENGTAGLRQVRPAAGQACGAVLYVCSGCTAERGGWCVCLFLEASTFINSMDSHGPKLTLVSSIVVFHGIVTEL